MTSNGRGTRPTGLIRKMFGSIVARLNADMEHHSVGLLELRGDERVLEIGYVDASVSEGLALRWVSGRLVTIWPT